MYPVKSTDITTANNITDIILLIVNTNILGGVHGGGCDCLDEKWLCMAVHGHTEAVGMCVAGQTHTHEELREGG